MKRLLDTRLLDSYIQKFDLNSIFEKQMSDKMELFSFNSGELICTAGCPIEYLFFLVDGKAKIYTMHDSGKSILLRFNRPLSVFGDMELLNDYRMQCNVESVEESLLIGIRVDIVRSMAGEDARFLKFIAESLSHKLYTMSNAASINLLNTLESRLASYILSVSDNDNNVYNYEIKTTKLTELATLLGTSYRHLNRVVNSLASKGIIQRQRGIITIKDPDELRKLSNGYLYE